MWMHRTQLLGDERMEPIDGVLDIHPERFKLVSETTSSVTYMHTVCVHQSTKAARRKPNVC